MKGTKTRVWDVDTVLEICKEIRFTLNRDMDTTEDLYRAVWIAERLLDDMEAELMEADEALSADARGIKKGGEPPTASSATNKEI